MAQILAPIVCIATLQAQAVPHAGRWQTNLSKSTFDPGPAPASQTRVYEILQDARGPAYDMTVTVNGSEVATGRKFRTVIVLEKP